MSIEPIKEEKILETLLKLKLNKGPDSDNIITKMLVYMGEAATKELSVIMNEILRTKMMLKD